MITNRKCSILAAALLGLCVATGAAIADQSCRNVQSNVKGVSEVFVNPEGICDGYEWGQYSQMRGTLNGLLWACWNSDGEEIVLSDSAFVLSAQDTMETIHGNIYAEERGIINFFADKGYVAHLGVTDGTGKYEAASGWLSLTLIGAGGLLTGEVCGPNL